MSEPATQLAATAGANGAEFECLDAGDLALLRLEQARALKERVLGSCLIVEFIIVYTAIIMAVVHSKSIAAAWFSAGTMMVAATYLYSRLVARGGLNRRNYSGFLQGHRIISGLTGLVWGGFSIYQLDYTAELTIFLGCLTVCSITLGGVFPSSAYRATYVALATTAIPPVGFYIAVTAPGPLRLVGVGLLVYYLFAMFISARVEIETRQTLAARNAKTLNEKIVAQNQRYLEASEEKSRFLAATSHDLSQPLQSQRFFMMALRELLDRPDQHELLDRIEESWRAQKDLLLGIVDVSRIDSGAIVPRIVPVDLAQECRKLADEFTLQGEAAGKGARIEAGDFTQAHVQTDSLLFARIVRNLLSNARKFTPDDGTIRFSAIAESDRAIVNISDTGPGIAEEDQRAVFGEYVRLPQDGASSPGLGLGLSIVERLCQLLQIEITLHSSPGQGTHFTLAIPVKQSADQPKPAGKAWADVFSEAPLVVLVDDDTAVVKAMTGVITSWGCKLVTATSSAEALHLLSQTPDVPGVLVIDKRLSENDDGMVLIEAIREEYNERIPAILMSGNLGRLAGYEDDGAMVFLNKPVEPADLRIAMQDMLRTR